MLQANNNNDEDDVLAFAFISIKIKVGGLGGSRGDGDGVCDVDGVDGGVGGVGEVVGVQLSICGSNPVERFFPIFCYNICRIRAQTISAIKIVATLQPVVNLIKALIE